MLKLFKKKLGKFIYKLLINYISNFKYVNELNNVTYKLGLIEYPEKLKNVILNSEIGSLSKLYPIYSIHDSKIGDYTYIAQNSIINHTTIGKFCSIGPNLVCGWGIHPTNGISTHPMFYSTKKQNGVSLSKEDKIEEVKPIFIGNDVFIGMNVTILDGVTIGDGAIIGAGAVVSKDIPPYAIAIGCPIKIVKYRFDEITIKRLLELKWWDSNFEDLKLIEENFIDVEKYLEIVENCTSDE